MAHKHEISDTLFFTGSDQTGAGGAQMTLAGQKPFLLGFLYSEAQRTRRNRHRIDRKH